LLLAHGDITLLIFVTQCRISSVRAEGVAMTEKTAPATEPATDSPDDVLAENLLVEEVSIDGMCGVY